MASGDIAEVVVKYTSPYGTYLNTFGFSAINSGATFANLASGFKTALVKATSGGLLFDVASSRSCSEIDVRDIKPGTAATYVSTFAAVAGSDGAGMALPPQVALVLSWKTLLQGRSYRGRTYLAGYTSVGETAAGDPSAGLIAAGNAIVTQMLAVYGPSGTDTNWQFGIISRATGGAPRPTPTFTAVTSGACRTIFNTQRRRVPGVGM